MNDELLIETVRIYSVLYDLSNPRYMDCKYKNRIWDEIGRKLNCEATTCKSRWCNIRDQYRKSLSKTKTKSGQSSRNVKLYKYHDLMSFLNPYFNERETKTNLSAANDSVEDYDTNTQVSMSPESTPEPNMDTFSTAVISPESSSNALNPESPSQLLSSPCSSPIFTRAASTITSAQGRNDNNPARSSAASLMEFVLRKNQVKSEHPIDKFLEGIAPTLKSLTPYYQNLAKSDIFGIVQNYEMTMLTENQQLSEPIQISLMDAVQPNTAQCESVNTANSLLNVVPPNDNVTTNETSNVVVPPNAQITITTSELPSVPNEEGAQGQELYELDNIRDYVEKFTQK